MNALWSYFWPLFALGLIAGAIAGSVGFRAPRAKAGLSAAAKASLLTSWKRRRTTALLAGLAAAIAGAGLWHGPAGGAQRFAGSVEREARRTLDYYEMTQVTARLSRDPLSRRLQLSGPADDFQRGELVRIMGGLAGVSDAGWSADSGVPLVLEAALLAIASFLAGLVLAYLVELRRRYNAQWSW